uniref:Uncharacterized protein n=1 Tax=Panagrolaimus sp. PS1159 TaxID=55785 RepID=A0AC35FJN0_9BILA
MDSYCPSLDDVKIKQRTCECGYYSSSAKSNKEHKASLVCLEGQIPSEEEDNALDNDDFLDVVMEELNLDDSLPIVAYDTVNSIRFSHE